jgi:predicted butyrate kinase (DUF1464 family)
LAERGPFDLVAGPSGYGLPLIRAIDCGERERLLMNLVRPDERGRAGGVAGFRALLEGFCRSGLPVVFLPGVIHLPSVPVHRKNNRIDLGTADKLCVAALALAQRCARRPCAYQDYRGCVVELGSVFTACLVLEQGRVVDAVGGTSGPCGWGGGGAWDGEVAYLFGPLGKRDLFAGEASALPEREQAEMALREGLVKAVAGLRACTEFTEIVLSGRLLETEPEMAGRIEQDLARLAPVARLEALPGAWVKHAAQGAAVLADGLAGGTWAPLVEQLELRQAQGTALSWLNHPRADEVRRRFFEA